MVINISEIHLPPGGHTDLFNEKSDNPFSRSGSGTDFCTFLSGCSIAERRYFRDSAFLSTKVVLTWRVRETVWGFFNYTFSLSSVAARIMHSSNGDMSIGWSLDLVGPLWFTLQPKLLWSAHYYYPHFDQWTHRCLRSLGKSICSGLMFLIPPKGSGQFPLPVHSHPILGSHVLWSIHLWQCCNVFP